MEIIYLFLVSVYFHIDISAITEYNNGDSSDITMEANMNPICTVRAPDELRRMLKKKAQERGITMNALILQILWGWIASANDVEVDTNDTDGDTQL